MTQLLLILADDLTGAADTAARCRQAGLPATIFLQPPAPPLPDGAVAFTSDSRHLPADQAAQRVHAVAAALREVPHAIWYKKIDSTLRGNLGSELEALLHILSHATPTDAPPCAVISPGFPAQRRGLRNGQLDMEQNGAPSVDLPALLRAQSTLPVALLSLDDVRTDVAHLADRLRAAYAGGAHLLVVDALTEDDLRTVLDATQNALPQALLCGSAGLVGVLAQQLTMQSIGADHASVEPIAPPDTVFVVVGSGSPMAHRQLDALRHQPDVLVTETAPGAERPVLPEDRIHCALHLPRPDAHAVLDGAEARRLAVHLGDTVRQVMARHRPDRLILVGGDTAIAVLERLGIQQLTVLCELLPGMPLTVGVDASGQEWQIVLKAGNHGDEQTLVRLLGVGRFRKRSDDGR